MFSLSRIKNASLTKQGFTIPADFNPAAYFDRELDVWASARTPFTVELLIDNEIGAYALERQWHSGQEVKRREDGVYVKFITTQIPEVLRWVLGQGHTVKVLNPPELVGMVKKELSMTHAAYAKGDL